jgi:hypothetical protein
LLIPLLVVGTASTARAESPGPLVARAEARDRAREHVDAASRAFVTHDYLGCVNAFRRAYDIAPMPQIRFNLGLCLERLARYREAAQEYLASAESSELSAEERARARSKLRSLQKRMGVARIATVDGFGSVLVDGETDCDLPCSIYLDPGRHEATVGSGPRRRVVRFRVRAGRRVKVRFPRREILDISDSPRPGGGKRGWLTWTGRGLAAVGVAGTVGFGLRTLSLRDQFEVEPTPELAASGDRMRSLTNYSLAVAVTGAVLILADTWFD